MALNGRFGEISGVAIPADVDLCASTGLIGAFTPESTRPHIKKLGIQATVGTRFRVNGVPCMIGKTGIFELDYDVDVVTLSFPDGADNSTIIDFIY